MKSTAKPGLGQGLKSGILPKVSISERMRSSSDFFDRAGTEFQTSTPPLSVGRGKLYVAMDQEYILASTKDLNLNLEQ
jgi:hypothetical protein